MDAHGVNLFWGKKPTSSTLVPPEISFLFRVIDQHESQFETAVIDECARDDLLFGSTESSVADNTSGGHDVVLRTQSLPLHRRQRGERAPSGANCGMANSRRSDGVS